MIYRLEKTICSTLGNKLTLLDVANCRAVCRMSQNFPSSLSTKIPMLQLCSRPSLSHVGKILIHAMPNADNHKIDLTAPCTKHKKCHVLGKKQLLL